MNRADYEIMKRELMGRKTYPYQFSNEEFSKEFFEIFKQEVPTAKYYVIDGMAQFVTYDRRAEKKLSLYIDQMIEKYKKEVEKLAAVRLQIQ